MPTRDLHKLPADKKLKILFELWDDIASSKETIALPDCVKSEIDRRCAEHEADPSIAIDEDEMWRRVDED